MSAHRILLVENPAELSIVDGRLRLRREAMDDVFVLPDDIAVLVLHHPMIRMSAHVLRALAQAGGMLLVTDEPRGTIGDIFSRKESAGKSRARSNRSTRDSTSASPSCARWWRGKSPRPVSTRPWAWVTTTWETRLILPMI